MNTFATSVTIAAAPAQVWAVLTEPQRVLTWLGEPDMQVEISTSWAENTPVTIRGFHHVAFENRGRVLRCQPHRYLRYSSLSSLSRLPDEPASYSILDFRLTPAGAHTRLTLVIENFPTEAIRKHLEFYWRNTLPLIRQQVEQLVRPDALARA